jgi:hypothetical protein
MFITGVNNTDDKLFIGVKLSTISAINPFHRFSVIAGVVVTGDKFIAGDNNTGEQLSRRQ